MLIKSINLIEQFVVNLYSYLRVGRILCEQKVRATEDDGLQTPRALPFISIHGYHIGKPR